jgi:DNA adenine methylase
MFDRVKRARAVWMPANSSYGHDITGGFWYDRNGGRTSKNLGNKRAAFTIDYVTRLQRARIECCDALRIIESRDTEGAFFYIDPPYVGTDQGRYDGYTQAGFDALLKLLEPVKGKFLLSSYRNKALREFTIRNGWHTVELRTACSMTHAYKTKRQKIEALTASYPIAVKPDAKSKK